MPPVIFYRTDSTRGVEAFEFYVFNSEYIIEMTIDYFIAQYDAPCLS